MLWACGPVPPGSDAGTDAGVEVSIVEACDRLATARCGLSTRCYAAFAGAAPDECRTVEQTACLAEYEKLKPSFEAGKVQVDGARLATCEQRLRTSSCPPTFPPGYPDVSARPFADCALQTGLLLGSVPSGETCERGVECAPGTLCVKPNGVCRGTCSSFPAVGEACAFGCAPGLFCDDQGSADPADDRCATPRGLDQPCADSTQCAQDLVCQGTCLPRSRLGEACRFDAARLSTCEPGLACDIVPFVSGQVGTCIRPEPEGGRCRFHWSCQSGLVCADLVWDGFPLAAPAQAGFCRPPSDADTNCPYTPYALYVGDQCRAGTSCASDTRKCTAQPRLGDACTPSQQNCAGLDVYCKPVGSGDVGACTGPVGQGERCAFEIDASRTVTIPCRQGACDAQSTQACQPASKQVGALCTQDGECVTNRCAVQQDRSQRCAQAC